VATAEAYYLDIPTILETTFGGMFEKKKRKEKLEICFYVRILILTQDLSITPSRPGSSSTYNYANFTTSFFFSFFLKLFLIFFCRKSIM
jgi:hypothetical protein